MTVYALVPWETWKKVQVIVEVAWAVVYDEVDENWSRELTKATCELTDDEVRMISESRA